MSNTTTPVVRADCYDCITGSGMCRDCSENRPQLCMINFPNGKRERSGLKCPHKWPKICTFFHTVDEYVQLSQPLRQAHIVPSCNGCLSIGKMCRKCLENPKLSRCSSILDSIHFDTFVECPDGAACKSMHPLDEAREFHGGKFPTIRILSQSTELVVPGCTVCTGKRRVCDDHAKTPKCGMGKHCTENTNCKNAHTIAEWNVFSEFLTKTVPTKIASALDLKVNTNRIAIARPVPKVAASPVAAPAPNPPSPPKVATSPPINSYPGVAIGVLEEKITELLMKCNRYEAKIAELESALTAQPRRERLDWASA